MDIERRKQLKKQGKAQVERDSAERKARSQAVLPDMLAALSHSGVLPESPDHLAPDARARFEKERWIAESRPTIHREQLLTEFVPLLDAAGKWTQHLLAYVMCKGCQSAVPLIPPHRLLYRSSCACGNLRWKRFLGYGRLAIRDPNFALPIALFGRANLLKEVPQQPE
jgi:hypothetical protein